MIFAVSFFGALFAILTSLLIVYTYVTLRLVPRLKQSFRKFVEEVGPKAVFERANLDPVETMRQLGIQQPSRPAGTDADVPGVVRVVFTCEDHGRCAGCPRVLAQFEAIVRCQGEDSFDEMERRCYDQLRKNEIDRQQQIAARVVEALVYEGVATTTALNAVWSCATAQRAAFSSWIIAARSKIAAAPSWTEEDERRAERDA